MTYFPTSSHLPRIGYNMVPIFRQSINQVLLPTELVIPANYQVGILTIFQQIVLRHQRHQTLQSYCLLQWQHLRLCNHLPVCQLIEFSVSLILTDICWSSYIHKFYKSCSICINTHCPMPTITTIIETTANVSIVPFRKQA